VEFVKIRFTNDIGDVGSKFEKSFMEIFHSMNPTFDFSKNSWKPQLDMFETPDEIIIIAEVAGVEKELLEIETSSRAIRISGKRLLIPPAKNGRYRLAEIRYGSFDRILHLPSVVDTEKVEASYAKGLLHIHLPKIKVECCKIPIAGE